MKAGIFATRVSLNLYEKDKLQELGTQVSCGRYLNVLTGSPTTIDEVEVIDVQLCEDGYVGQLRFGEYLNDVLVPGTFRQNLAFSRTEILKAIPEVLAFLFEAMQTPNRYFWGGTIGPNFDCSGLVQAAFASQGIWLPRNAKEQCKFTATNPVHIDKAEPGDLLFFSHTNEIDHVGIHLGNGFFIHSSGPSLGRDGIGIDRLTEKGGGVAANYSPFYRCCHKVCSAWRPQRDP